MVFEGRNNLPYPVCINLFQYFISILAVRPAIKKSFICGDISNLLELISWTNLFFISKKVFIFFLSFTKKKKKN